MFKHKGECQLKMLIIDKKEKTIHINRGNDGTISFKIPLNKEKTEFYQFEVGDIVTFGVYEANGMDKDAALLKNYEIQEPTDTAQLTLTNEDTKIGELINNAVEYWYEIELNRNGVINTVIGYDTDGAKLFILYPEGSMLEQSDVEEEQEGE